MKWLRQLLPPRTWPESEALLPAARLVPLAAAPRRAALRLALTVFVFLLFGVLAPWRQNLAGSGQVTAFAPDERSQALQATISGRIGEWHVVEGSRVEAGEVLVELRDNDPERLARLELQLEAAQERLGAHSARVEAYEERVAALERAQRAELDAVRAEVQAAVAGLEAKRELLAAVEARVAAASRQEARIEGLASDGLASQRERELAELGATSAEANLRAARAGVRVAESELHTKRAALERVRASTDASISSATAASRSAETEVASTQGSLAGLESRLAQQAAQAVRAPRAGVVQRVLVQQGGMQVSRGQTLAYLVPDTESRAVQLYVDGNDAALITAGRRVRLQFEGWPAVQFAGWPSVAVGTFGGRVAFVDPSDDGQGDFRVVVLPDETDEPWPDARFLRQGTRAKGWVLLDEVSIGFEIWRQLNGFPPSFRSAPPIEGGP